MNACFSRAHNHLLGIHWQTWLTLRWVPGYTHILWWELVSKPITVTMWLGVGLLLPLIPPPKTCLYVPIYSSKCILNLLIQAEVAFSITVLENKLVLCSALFLGGLLLLPWMVKTDRWMLSSPRIKTDICGLFVFKSTHEVTDLFLFFTLNDISLSARTTSNISFKLM